MERPIKEPEAVPGMYTVEFTKERLGFRVLDCEKTEHKLRVGIITDETLKEDLTENDEIYALNGYTLEELGTKSHGDFAKEVISTTARPLYVTFISEADIQKSVIETVGGIASGGLAMIGFGGDDEEEEDAVKVTSISFSEGTLGGDGPASTRTSMDHGYEVRDANDWDPDLSEAFGFSNGYHPFSLKYTKYMALDPNNANMDKVERGYLEFGRKVLVVTAATKEAGGKGEYGVVAQHYKKYNRKKEHDKKRDTFDIKLWDGTTLKNVVLDDLTPIEIIYIPLACGLSLEDFCLYGACLGCVWSALCAFFGILMFSHEETAHAQTALKTFFLLGTAFAAALVLIVYIGRTLAVIQDDEEEAELKRETEEYHPDDDEEIGLMGRSLEVE
mmetsp:Transcript_10574/g.28098  ORF Transcript_10574/g.28098 Transcript_10574/m.28098 type:complete len:388 (-) Transcript_10574:530-1693(-)